LSSVVAFRNRIDELQEAMAAYPKAEFKLEHYYAHGLYGRELFIPKGTIYVGKIHRFSHIRVVLKGHLFIVTEDGRQEYLAPHVMVTPEGTRRVGYAFEDTLVMTVHATDQTDLDEIEHEIIMPRDEQLLTESEHKLIESLL
jgi:hypothetical protein